MYICESRPNSIIRVKSYQKKLKNFFRDDVLNSKNGFITKFLL